MTLYYSLVSWHHNSEGCRYYVAGDFGDGLKHGRTRTLLTPPAQVFLLLVSEMALFMLLVVPLPFTIRRKMFTFMSVCPSPLRSTAAHNPTAPKVL
jgi:hypothetical protein